MGSKIRPGKFDCANKALPDEETFTLLARSPEFAETVRFFAQRRFERTACGDAPVTDQVLVSEAREVAARGEYWRRTNSGAWRHRIKPFSAADGSANECPPRNPELGRTDPLAAIRKLDQIPEARGDDGPGDRDIALPSAAKSTANLTLQHVINMARESVLTELSRYGGKRIEDIIEDIRMAGSPSIETLLELPRG
jgi:hypothetical protein